MKKAATLAILLAGCGPLEPRPLPPEAPPVPPREAGSFAAPVAWKGLTLEQALRLTDQGHPDLAAALSRVRAAEARAVQAGLLPNPELAVRMESAPFLDGSTTGDAELLAGLSQRLPLGGRLAAAERVEELERDRLLKEAEVRRLDLHSRVRAAFAAALYAEEAEKVQASGLELAGRGVAVTRVRLQAGDALPEDAARTEIEEVRARLELERARTLRTLALLGLAGAVGDPALRIEGLEGSLEEALEVPALEAVLARLGEGEVAALAEAEVAVGRAREELARAQRIPDVNVELLYRRIGSTDTSAFDAGIGVALPLFDGNRARIREAQAGIREAEARGRAVRNERARQLREAHARLVRSVAQSRALREELLPRVETVLKGAEARTAAGDMSLADLLPVRRERTLARLAYLESLRDLMESWGALKPFLR